ncbi:MAG: hypothetical protein PHY26_02335 [Bacilli bacterium]|nr:hypothetical protein [Bacilli bacterium]
MKKKLPTVFVNKIEKKIKNNETIFYSAKTKEKKINNKKSNNKSKISIKTKIDKMFDSPKYIYKINATITMKTGDEWQKNVIGVIDNKLVTIDEEYIPISEIEDINY